MQFSRSSGILLHITSLPGPFGTGDLGRSSSEFVDFLANAGQKIWQVLPVNPPSLGHSPYSSYSVFAGNPLLICPREMISAGWLDSVPTNLEELSPTDALNAADFGLAKRLKDPLFQQAFAQSRSRLATDDAYRSFCQDQAWWLDGFARFEALMHHFDSSDWAQWPRDIRHPSDQALREWDERLAAEIDYSKFLQFVFEQQWSQLKRHANQRGIQMYGDLSFYVAHESADVWANQSLFHLDDVGAPTLVAGVPPDYFSETGQRWGNPLYRWDVMQDNQFAWWTGRFRRAQSQFDLLRVDHFRGFESFWEIPAEAPTAQSGRWQTGPGKKPFEAATEALGELPIIAEDLGMITEEVHELRECLGFPPMRVLQFGFESAQDDFHRPNRYPEHSVAYTGTHDNDTTMGWYGGLGQDHPAQQLLAEVVDLDADDELHWKLIELVLEADSHTAIIPLQDLLGLGREARMNVPGEADGNWMWRVDGNLLTDALASRLQAITSRVNR